MIAAMEEDRWNPGQLGLSLRRLPQDMRNLHGYLVLLAETFVDGSRFSGACHRASNWRHLGSTSGFFRVLGR